MAKAGQTLNDRLNAARYALSGQGLARVVCKATTEELVEPKKKHLDCIINLLDKYFDLDRKRCREACKVYEQFCQFMDKAQEFLQVAQDVGVDRRDTYVILNKAPSSLLTTLEQHLEMLDAKHSKKPKGGLKDSQVSSTTNVTSTTPSKETGDVADSKESEAVKKALEEEAALMNQLKDQVANKNFTLPADTIDPSQVSWIHEKWSQLEKHVQDQSKKTYNPFLASPTAESKPEVTSTTRSKKSSDDIFDLFLNDTQSTTPKTVGIAGFSSPTMSSTVGGGLGGLSDDLLSLSAASAATSSTSPFAGLMNTPAIPPITSANPFAEMLASAQAAPIPPNATTNGVTSTNNSSFNSGFDANFAAVFGNQNTTSSTSHGESKPPPVRPPPPSKSTPKKQDKAVKIDEQTHEEAPIPDTEEVSVAAECLQVPNDQGIDRSASPSPTSELIIRGDGTTPILPTPPEQADEDDDDGHHSASVTRTPERSSSPSSATPARPTETGDSPFGAAFELIAGSATEQVPPARLQPPEAATDASPTEESSTDAVENDLFGFDNSFNESTNGTGVADQADSAQDSSGLSVGGAFMPMAPPPSPFSGFDLTNMNQQQILYIQQPQLAVAAAAAASAAAQPVKKKSAFEDLDFAMRETMTKGKEGGQTTPGSKIPTVPGLPAGMIPAMIPGVYPQIIPITGPGGVIMGAYPPGVFMPQAIPQGAAAFDAFGDILQPQKQGQVINAPAGSTTANNNTTGIIKGDLDSSLASLAQNLDINGPKGAAFRKPGQQQFNQTKSTVKTGATSWNMPPNPMIPGAVATPPGTVAWPQGAMVGGVPVTGVPVAGVQMIPGAVPPAMIAAAGAPGAQWIAAGSPVSVAGAATGTGQPRPGVAGAQWPYVNTSPFDRK